MKIKKFIPAVTFLGFLALASSAFAQVNINIVPPTGIPGSENDAGKVLSNIIKIIFSVAVLAVLFMLIFGAFQWITSGGDKEGVTKARERITHALVGLAILALSFLIVAILGAILKINLLSVQLPSLLQ